MANGWQEQKPPDEFYWIRAEIQNWFRGLKEWIFGFPDEEEAKENTGEPARAITRWHSPRARKLRIAWWRTFRPWIRWKRRHPMLWGLVATAVVLVTIGFTTKFFLDLSLPSASSASTVPASPLDQNPEDKTLPSLALQLSASWQDLEALPASLALSQPRQVLWRQTNETFAAGDFPAAEKGYRQFEVMYDRGPMLFFRLMLCLIAQGKQEEALLVAAKVPSPEAATGPAAYYVRAVILWLDEKPAEGAKLIREANTRFPLVAADYIRVMSQFVAHFPAISDLVDSALPGLAEKASED